MNLDKLNQAVRLFLEGLDLDLNDQHFKNTPARVAKAWTEYFGVGYTQDPKTVLSVEFTDDYDQMIIVKDIPYLSWCKHHIVPFFGTAKIGYLPNKKSKKITGLSKLGRVVQIYANRLQIQETLTREIANAIQDILEPEGVGVVIDGEHMCMSRRGVRSVGAKTVTSCLLGSFRSEPETRAEFLNF